MAVRQSVKIASEKEGTIPLTLGATPFGFFLSTIIFCCCKLVLYMMLYAVRVNMADTGFVPQNPAQYTSITAPKGSASALTEHNNSKRDTAEGLRLRKMAKIPSHRSPSLDLRFSAQ